MFAVSSFIVTTLVVLCCEVSCAVHNRPDVERMHVVAAEADDALVPRRNWNLHNGDWHNAFKLLNRDHGTQISNRVMAHSFSWKSCGGSSDLLVINSLSVSPDPLPAPGTISLSFDVTIQQTFDDPLTLSLDLQKHELFVWITIPCIDNIGSCTYSDICQTLSGMTCPQPFVDYKIPCKCPFNNGTFTLPTSSFNIDQSVPGGDYYVKAQLSSGSQSVNCIEMYFSIS